MNDLDKGKTKIRAGKMKKNLALLFMASLLFAGCSGSGANGSKDQTDQKVQEDQNSQKGETGTDDNTNPDDQNGHTAAAEVDEDGLPVYTRDTNPGGRTQITLEEATNRKNKGDKFVLLFTEQDCSYCKDFDTVLDPYLEDHAVEIYEVDLTTAEMMYVDSDLETMLDICTGGLSKTPALYYVESPENVSLLDHTEANYSKEGLDYWVRLHQLDTKAAE